MPSIERTAYPCFSPITTASELQQSFTPTDTERAFAQASTRTNHHAFCFLVLLKCFQRLHYFPQLKEIPSVIVDHLRSCLQLRPDVPLAYENERTLYRHCATIRESIREYLRITTFYGKQAVAPTQTKENTTQKFMFIEKRSKLRFPLDCEISFQVGPHHGVGRLVDVSSKAVAFRTEADLPDSTLVQVSIPWPVRLGDCPLKLVALGRVMNKRSEVVVVSIDLHEFRTRGNPVESPPLLVLRSTGKTPHLEHVRLSRHARRRRPVCGSELVKPRRLEAYLPALRPVATTTFRWLSLARGAFLE